MKIKQQIKSIITPYVKKMLPDYVTFDQNRNDRAGALYRAWGLIISNKIAGGYFEFGVYQGESFRESYRIFQGYVAWMKSQKTSQEVWRQKIKWGWNHHFYAFDTFEGMPTNNEGNENFSQGTFLGSLEVVKAEGKKIGMLEGKAVQYFKGTFAEIAKN